MIYLIDSFIFKKIKDLLNLVEYVYDFETDYNYECYGKSITLKQFKSSFLSSLKKKLKKAVVGDNIEITDYWKIYVLEDEGNYQSQEMYCKEFYNEINGVEKCNDFIKTLDNE